MSAQVARSAGTLLGVERDLVIGEFKDLATAIEGPPEERVVIALRRFIGQRVGRAIDRLDVREFHPMTVSECGGIRRTEGEKNHAQ